jgi:hypothetical protein
MYDNEKEYGTNEIKNIFWIAVFTSWESPCSLWENNLSRKSKFLPVSSLITITVHLFCNLFVVFASGPTSKFLWGNVNTFLYVGILALFLSFISSVFLQIFGDTVKLGYNELYGTGKIRSL